MKLIIAFSLIAFPALAEETPKAAPDLAAKLAATEQELRLAKLENLVRREEAAVQQVEQIRKDQAALFAETCKAAGIEADPKVCAVDLNTKTVTRREAAKEKK
jgi:hypothetical protein